MFRADRQGIGVAGGAPGTARVPGRSIEATNRWMLRARDAIDRDYARPLDIPALAKLAFVSEGHFIRTFHAVFGEPPHRYLQRRRVERAMALLRNTDRSVTEICLDVGFTSLGTFSRTFRAIVGESPSSYRQQAVAALVPTCFTMAWTRPAAPGAVVPGPVVPGPVVPRPVVPAQPISSG